MKYEKKQEFKGDFKDFGLRKLEVPVTINWNKEDWQQRTFE